jgi:voltage-gated potassium channel Kch
VLPVLAGGAAFASVENLSLGDGVYWAIVTMTTVGYGDISPKTAEGKAIAITVMLVGIGFAALVVGAIADRFIHPPVATPVRPRTRGGRLHVIEVPRPVTPCAPRGAQNAPG